MTEIPLGRAVSVLLGAGIIFLSRQHPAGISSILQSLPRSWMVALGMFILRFFKVVYGVLLGYFLWSAFKDATMYAFSPILAIVLVAHTYTIWSTFLLLKDGPQVA